MFWFFLNRTKISNQVKLFLTNIAILESILDKKTFTCDAVGGRSPVAEFSLFDKISWRPLMRKALKWLLVLLWDTPSVSHIILSCKIVKIFCNGTLVPYRTLAFKGEGKYWTCDHCVLQFQNGCGWRIIDLKSRLETVQMLPGYVGQCLVSA